MAEIAANATPSATTGVSPIHAVYGYEPHMDFDIPAERPDTPSLDLSKHHAKCQAEALAMSLRETWGDLKEVIQMSQARVSSRENAKHRDPVLAPGELAFLDTRHLSWGHPTPKLDYRWTGPHKVEAIHGGSATLLLPAGSKIHLKVNLSYLRRFDNDPLPAQATDAESPDLVNAGKDPSEDQFEVMRSLEACINRQYCGGRLQFRVVYHEWPDNPTWYNADDGEFSHAKDALDVFYALPSTVARLPYSAEVSLPPPPTDKCRNNPFFPRGGGGGGVTGRRPSIRSLQTPITLP